MPLLETKGAGSAQGFGLTLQQATPVYIEDVFSTYLYTGNGYPTSNTQSINNGIDLSTKGGLVWIKVRSQAGSNALVDTARGYDKYLYSNITAAQGTATNALTAFNNNGFSLGADSTLGVVNENNQTYASWTFREQAKFFDVVTWTGNGTNPRQIAHNLGSVPGCIIVKSTTRAENWTVYHRSLGNAARMALNTTDAQVTGTGVWGSTTPTSTYFTVSADNLVNFNGDGYVAYIFAHDAGGFGLTGTDNVISCGSFTGGSPATVNLGYEPQWLLIKSATNADNWYIFDTMRGWTVNYSGLNYLIADSSGAENTGGTTSGLTNTGFNFNYGSGQTFIYIAIRRGPMKTPTSGTSVYGAVARTGTGASATVTGLNFPPDLFFYNPNRSGNSGYVIGWFDRLRGTTQRLRSDATSGESNYGTDSVTSYNMNGVTLGVDSLATGINTSGIPVINWFLGRAPGFFDEVCYSGTTVNPTVFNHNLGVVPELMILKRRNSTSNWSTYYNIGVSTFSRAFLNLTNIGASFGYADGAGLSAQPTATTFTLDDASAVNASGSTYVAYLFASCPGVSKVGTYTGTGALQTINCGFTGGARFVLIKRTDATSNWFVWDSTRGITSGNDPYLYLNSTATEVTGTNYVDTTSVGFQVTAAAPADLNASGGTYLFLAIA